MSDTAAGVSPRLAARMAGWAYLVVIAAALFAEMVVRGGLVTADAAETARNILANETRWRAGFAADLVSVIAYVLAGLLLYRLTRVASRGLALGATAFGLLGSGVMAINLMAMFAPVVLLGSALPPEVAAVLARASIRLHGTGYSLAIVFFSVQLIGWGWLILRSTFLPRPLGLLLIASGALGLVKSFAGFVVPDLAAPLYPIAMVLSLLAEGGLALWLSTVGLNAARWREQAAAARAPEAA